MRFIYQRQLPGKEPRVTKFEGWIAALVSVLVLIGLLAVLVILLPFLLIGVLAFVAFVLFVLVGGWIYLGFRIGFGGLWELTKLALGIGWGSTSLEGRKERLRKMWEDRIKGRHGEWVK